MKSNISIFHVFFKASNAVSCTLEAWFVMFVYGGWPYLVFRRHVIFLYMVKLP